MAPSTLLLDTHFFAFAGVAALLVLSPGATMVVVADAAIEAGRRAALWTVAGIGTANATLTLASAFGLSAVVHRAPGVLRVMSIVGAGYLAWLGVRALWRAVRGETGVGARHAVPLRDASPLARFGRGLLTNYANPSVVLFYAVVVSQFITPHEAFLPRYLLLGGTHVAMSVVWQATVGISVGTFAERMTRPGVRRTMDLLMGSALVALAVELLLA
jgi:threonine/homoserine/homoserine lactone efflux protein